MGTHPIFESDFDCLTEMLSRTTRIISRKLFFARSRFGFIDDLRFASAKFVVTQLCKLRAFRLTGSKRSLKTPSDELASGTKIALVRKLLLQGLVKRGSRGGLENDSDMTEMFCPPSPDLKYKTREQWDMLSRNDKIFFGKEIFEDCEIFSKKYVARDGQLYFEAFVNSKVSKLPERYQDIKTCSLIKNGDKYGYHYVFVLLFKYDEKTEKWQLQETPYWPIDGRLETLKP